jgi:hypothetical protein
MQLVVVVTVFLHLLVSTAGAQAPPPRPEHQPLEALVGTWTYERHYVAGPTGPGGTARGTDHNELLGGFFLVRRYEETSTSGVVSGIDVVGYDPSRQIYADTFFNSTGASGSGTVRIDGNTWTFVATGTVAGRAFQQRCGLAFGPNLLSFTMACDTSTDGAAWTQRFEGTWTKSGR